MSGWSPTGRLKVALRVAHLVLERRYVAAEMLLQERHAPAAEGLGASITAPLADALERRDYEVAAALAREALAWRQQLLKSKRAEVASRVEDPNAAKSCIKPVQAAPLPPAYTYSLHALLRRQHLTDEEITA